MYKILQTLSPGIIALLLIGGSDTPFISGLYFCMKELQLSQGKTALVDDEDYGYLSRFKWTAVKHRNTFYAVRTEYADNKSKGHRLHRVIMGYFTEGVIIDHKDGNGLNCQKNNLRICQQVQNRHNATGWGQSKYPGVTKRGKKWIARIRPAGKLIYLGSFDTEELAAEAYNKKSIELYGDFALKMRESI